MSELFEKIQKRIKEAMVSGDTSARDCLRSAVSDIKNRTVNANPQVEITDGICLKVLEKSAKTHMDSISQFESAGRTDLAEKEKAELKVIESFLPKQMTPEETKAFVEKFVPESGIEPVKKNMGMFMKAFSGVQGLDRKLAAGILGKVLK